MTRKPDPRPGQLWTIFLMLCFSEKPLPWYLKCLKFLLFLVFYPYARISCLIGIALFLLLWYLIC